MKKVFFITTVFISVACFSQIVKVPGTEYPFYSDIIKFQDSEYEDMLEIIPANKDVNLSAAPPELDSKIIEKSILNAVNSFRKQYGRKPVKFSKAISSNLSNALLNDEPFDKLSWSTLGFFYEFNYVGHFKNKEEKFCDFLLDVMSVDSDNFLELIAAEAKEVGFLYKQDEIESQYEFAIYIR